MRRASRSTESVPECWFKACVIFNRTPRNLMSADNTVSNIQLADIIGATIAPAAGRTINESSDAGSADANLVVFNTPATRLLTDTALYGAYAQKRIQRQSYRIELTLTTEEDRCITVKIVVGDKTSYSSVDRVITDAMKVLRCPYAYDTDCSEEIGDVAWAIRHCDALGTRGDVLQGEFHGSDALKAFIASWWNGASSQVVPYPIWNARDSCEPPVNASAVSCPRVIVRDYVWRAIQFPPKIVWRAIYPSMLISVHGYTIVQLEKYTGETLNLSTLDLPWGIIQDGMLLWSSATFSDISNIVACA